MADQKPGAPFIAKPDEIDVQNGEACWLNSVRVCGADCIAFNIDETDENGAPVQGPTKCTLIVLAGQVASGVTALVQLKQRDQKARQTPQAPPPPKAGG
jgi:hypothetical protein